MVVVAGARVVDVVVDDVVVGAAEVGTLRLAVVGVLLVPPEPVLVEVVGCSEVVVGSAVVVGACVVVDASGAWVDSDPGSSSSG